MLTCALKSLEGRIHGVLNLGVFGIKISIIVFVHNRALLKHLIAMAHFCKSIPNLYDLWRVCKRAKTGDGIGNGTFSLFWLSQ